MTHTHMIKSNEIRLESYLQRKANKPPAGTVGYEACLCLHHGETGLVNGFESWEEPELRLRSLLKRGHPDSHSWQGEAA